MSTSDPSAPMPRLASGIDGLDSILNGGFFQGDLYLLIGSPGAGKTVLASQLCFNHIQRGGRVLYATLLAEDHTRLLSHLRGFDYFDASVIPEQLYFVSGYPTLQSQGLEGLRKLLHDMVRSHRATVLVLEGLETAASLAPNEIAFKQFVLDLHTFLSARRATTFLISLPRDHLVGAEYGMVDGLLELRYRRDGLRARRELAVLKLRGSPYLEGSHLFDITGQGIKIFPRTEALLASPSAPAIPSNTRLGFGLANLDDMLQGGIPVGSTTMLLGAPGSGKTILSSHFLSQCRKEEEMGLYFGFYESPPQLLAKANELGLPLQACVDQGQLAVQWQSPLATNADELAQRLLTEVRRRQVRRLVIDGIEGFETAALDMEGARRLFVALGNELRGLGVTTLFTVEAQNRFGPEMEVPIVGAGMMADNIILLRYVALRSQLYRVLSVVKMRNSAYDPAVREFGITRQGFEIANTVESAEAIMREVADPRAAPAPRSLSQESDS